jgi:hypothetical protein
MPSRPIDVLERGCTTSAQGVNEFANVARR